MSQCAGDKARRMVVDDLLATCDILCLQETFLAKQDLEKLNCLNDNFHGAGESTTDLSMGIVRGRIPGGVAILWNKKLDSLINVIRLGVDWCIAIHCVHGDKEFVVLNVYTPYECRENEDEYLHRLAFINSFIQDSSCSNIYVVGDMNADLLDSKSLFSNHMLQFSEDNNLILSSKECLPINSYTYISEAWHTTSWLDHCISTADAHASLGGMDILYGMTTTDHIPVAMSLNVDLLPAVVKDGCFSTEKINWTSLTKDDFLTYFARTDEFLSKVQICKNAVICRDMNCKDEEHRRALCSVYNDIVAALHEGSRPFLKHKNKKYMVRPGWKDFVAEYQTEAREAFKLWDTAGRPKQGCLLEHKQRTNAKYKYAIRYITKNEQAIRADSMAKKLLDNNVVEFWKEVRVLNNCKASLPCTVDGTSGSHNIAELWRQHYSNLFNCLKSDLYKADCIRDDVSVEINTHEVYQAINRISDNKASGIDHITAEHLKYASLRTAPLLSLCFTGFMVHGLLPDSMLSVLLVPVVKDKAGKISSLDNYRPIALASILSKVLELIMLDRINELIYSTDNQFGFKAKHGTDLCIFALKEIVNKYRSLNSSVFMCFIDASKAFDRVNHRKLFIKLKERGVPAYLVRILAYWYTNQTMQVKWGDSVSGPFRVGNGVRQGGILSPVLFNLYVDDLSKRLNACKTGCMVGDMLVNHLMYADDLVVLSPSSAGLQQLLNICTEYGMENDIKYNASKSAVLISRTKEDKCQKFPVFKLSNNNLCTSKKVKYLGHIITDQMSDDDDIYRQCRSMYAQANILVRKFSMCTEGVKMALFRSYCTSLYTAQLWAKYKKASLQKLQVAYNDAMRILLKRPRWSSASEMFVAARVNTFNAVLRNVMYKFMCRLDVSENSVIIGLTNPRKSCTRYTSSLREHWHKNLYGNLF